MGAVYGDVLSFFPEQFRTVEYFDMKSRPGAGYGERIPLGKVRGVFQYFKAGSLVRENDVLSGMERPVFWSRRRLDVGKFISLEGTDDIYRIRDHDEWAHEGGFVQHNLETVTGSTDTQEPFEYVNLGQYD